jgi:lactate dehydrogenase-like 2-hydroxyacid dehydrogenase
MANPYYETMAAAFEDELEKIAMTSSTAKTIGLIGAGAIGAETIRRAEKDRRMGRMMRLQQGY